MTRLKHILTTTVIGVLSFHVLSGVGIADERQESRRFSDEELADRAAVLVEELQLDDLQSELIHELEMNQEQAEQLDEILSSLVESLAAGVKPAKAVSRLSEALESSFGRSVAVCIGDHLAGDGAETRQGRVADVDFDIELAEEPAEAVAEAVEEQAAAVAAAVEAWAEQFAEEMEEHAERLEAQMEEFGEKMEEWTEQFAEGWEAWAEEHESEWESWAAAYSEKWEQWSERLQESAEEEDIHEVVRGNLHQLSEMPLLELYDQVVRSAKQVDDIPWEKVEGVEETVRQSIQKSLSAMEEMSHEEHPLEQPDEENAREQDVNKSQHDAIRELRTEVQRLRDEISKLRRKR